MSKTLKAFYERFKNGEFPKMDRLEIDLHDLDQSLVTALSVLLRNSKTPKAANAVIGQTEPVEKARYLNMIGKTADARGIVEGQVDADAKLEVARSYFFEGDFEAAADLCGDLLLDPENLTPGNEALAEQILGACHIEEGNFASARTRLEKSSVLYSTLENQLGLFLNQLNLVKLEALEGRAVEAEERYSKLGEEIARSSWGLKWWMGYLRTGLFGFSKNESKLSSLHAAQQLAHWLEDATHEKLIRQEIQLLMDGQISDEPLKRLRAGRRTRTWLETRHTQIQDGLRKIDPPEFRSKNALFLSSLEVLILPDGRNFQVAKDSPRFRVLELLLQGPLEREELFEKAWGLPWSEKRRNLLNVTIKNLRDQLGLDVDSSGQSIRLATRLAWIGND